MPKKKTKDIQVVNGNVNPNILLIAPHGVKGDDDNAGRLAVAIQKKLDCHAIINEAFKKPEKDDKDQYGEADIEGRLADLNFIPHAQAHPTFIESITSKITDPGNTHVFWIHGIDDINLAKEAQKRSYGDAKCLVGYGQGNGNGQSMNADKAKQFVNLLTDNDLSTKATHAQSKDYRGVSETNMTQYFKITGGNLAGVQSVQLEFAKEGVRVSKHIAETAVKVARAISDLLKCETVGISEDKPDDDLVKEATDKVIEFVTANHKNSIAVGRYLIEKFYDNNFQYARKGKKVKGKSLNKMLEDLQDKPDTPSKSWFYNTINLAVDSEEFKDDPEYKKLNLSQKIYLTYLNKNEKQRMAKLGLIKEIAKDGMAIKDLSARIAEIKAKPQQEWPSTEEIVAMDDGAKKKEKWRAEQRKKTLEKAIQELRAKLAEQESELSKCQEVITAVEGPVEEAPMKKAA
jgi:hypothetical protein